MKVLHVNNVDLLGNRFNGHDMQIELNKRGIEAWQAVMDRLGDDPHTILIPGAEKSYIRNRIRQLEEELSIHGLLYPFLFRLRETSEYKKADIVHYHLLHNYFGCLSLLPQLTYEKHSVITFHDPWFFTGHCVHPETCKKWRTGCDRCERLDALFPMKQDKSALMWSIKRDVFSKAKIDIVVASDFMKRFVQESPITKGCKYVHQIPFGIDAELFKDNPHKKEEVRHELKIQDESFVLLFRTDPTPYKGFSCIKKMLDILKSERPITLIGVGSSGMLNKYSSKYQVIDLGWITDNKRMAELYCACDVFIMPSTAESFGMMAIESMSSSRPVIVCEGTALPDVTHAPECGICIPQNDAKAMSMAIQHLIIHPEECKKRGELGRELVLKEYRFEDYVNRHIKLYRDIITRKEK